MKFFKAVNVNDLKDNYIPGTVTTDFDEAKPWYDISCELFKVKMNEGSLFICNKIYGYNYNGEV